MKLAALLLFFAIIGKIGAAPVPIRLAFYRANPEQTLQDELDEAEEETDISTEADFSNDAIQDEIQDDDDDSDEQEPPPTFSKLFPLPQRNSPGYHFPLHAMMGEVSQQGWNVPKRPAHERQRQRGRNELELARDDEDDDSDEDDDEEDDEDTEDDLPDWNKLFPNYSEQGQGPPSSVVDTSSQPELPASFRSAIGGSRVVYVPARQLRRVQQVPTRQYVMRSPSTSRFPGMYTMMHSSGSPAYMRRPVYQSRPQYVYSSNMQRRPGQVYYMPVRRNSYNPYVSQFVPRYRYY